MKLDNYNNVFFIGIGGSGMSALANYFIGENKKVGGYDKFQSTNTNNLEFNGVSVIYKDNIKDVANEYLDFRNTQVVKNIRPVDGCSFHKTIRILTSIPR